MFNNNDSQYQTQTLTLYKNATAQMNKGVASQHPQYIKYMDQWARCRNVSEGSDAVKANGTKYLPKLKGQTVNSYVGYVIRANFYNATGRTIGGLLGMLFRKPIVQDIPTSIEPFIKDIDMSGTPFDVFASSACQEILKTGRIGILVDFPPQPEKDAVYTIASAEKAGLRPMLKQYTAENIINWKFSKINNVSQLIQVVLHEQITRPILNLDGTPNEFENQTIDQYRVLDLVNNQYRQRLFERKDEKDILIEELFPLMNNTFMDYIPFILVTPEGVDWCVTTPPLIDLVDVNLSHYRTSADYEHGCHFTGLPTLWVSGYQAPVPEGGGPPEQISLGSETALILSDPEGKVAYAEFTGQGLQSLKDNLDRKEQQMAVLGARMLATEGRQAQSSTTTAIHRTGENSVLAAISIFVSLGLSQAMTIFAKWQGTEAECKVQINRDFLPVTVDGQTITALVGAWQAGALNDEEMFDYNQRADIIEADVDFEQHKAGDFQEKPEPLAVNPAKPPVGKPNQSKVKANPEKP